MCEVCFNQLRNPIIRQVVDRCHVGDTNREVIRYVISRFKRGYQTYRMIPKHTRRSILLAIIGIHRNNRQLYIHVMRGVN